MELITPTTAKVMAYYDHPVWGKYAAITQNNFGKGVATYIGCVTSNAVTTKIMEDVVKKAGLWSTDQEIAFPLITRSGTNKNGKTVHYYFNYSSSAGSFVYPYANGEELLSGQSISKGQKLSLDSWGVLIVEEK